MNVEECENIIAKCKSQNKALKKGLGGLAIRSYERNNKTIAAARKLIRIQKSKEYQNYLKTKSKKLA